jgi:hypothetical protein
MFRKVYKNLAFLVAATGNALVLLPLFRLFKNRYPRYAVEHADICIEGFPRSGNSFFVTTFQQWNPRAVVTHHSHLASNAKYSVRRGKPTVVLVRKPADAIASAIAWDGRDARILPGVGLIAYLSFYRALRNYKDNILFLEFDEAITRPDKCVAKINRRFSSSFNARAFTSEESQRLRALLVRQDSQNKRSDMNASLPNEKKGRMKLAILPEITGHTLFSRAQILYDDYASLAADDGGDFGID